MNKAEAIKSKIEKADMYLNGFQVNSKPKNIWVARNLLFEVKSDLENLETVGHNQKVLIPKFVADWWECLTDIDGLFDYILKYQWNENSAYDDFVPNDVLDWIFDNNDSFVLALRLITGELDYEVEKEKLYRVEIPTDFDNNIKTYFKGFAEKSVTPEFAYIQKNALMFADFEKAKSVAYLITGNVREVEGEERKEIMRIASELNEVEK